MIGANQKSNFIAGDRQHITANPKCRFSKVNVFIQTGKPSIQTFLAVVAILGGQVSSVRGSLERTPAPGLATDGSERLQVRCGLHSVCHLATHFCDSVVKECIRCSDDCHPGRITGNRHATDECQKKCKVYYEVQKESERQIAIKKTNDQISKTRLDDLKKQHSRRIHDAEIDEISKSLKRLETLKAIEIVCVAAITAILFVTSVILAVLLHRRGAASSSERPWNVYTSLGNGSK